MTCHNMRIHIFLGSWSEVGTVISALDASDSVKSLVRTLVVKAYEAGLDDGAPCGDGETPDVVAE